jgi:hypothetical protein
VKYCTICFTQITQYAIVLAKCGKNYS